MLKEIAKVEKCARLKRKHLPFGYKIRKSAIATSRLLIDCFVSIFLITNLVVVVWRSIWDAQDFYYTTNVPLNNWISIFLSTFITVLIKIKQLRFYKRATHDVLTNNKFQNLRSPNSVGPFELKLCIWVFAFANINNWSISTFVVYALFSISQELFFDWLVFFPGGVWNLTLYYTNHAKLGIYLIGLVCFLTLCLTKRSCSLLSAPFQINKDSLETFYQIQNESLKSVDSKTVYVSWLRIFERP